MLQAMEPKDYALLAGHLALVELPVGFKIAEKKKKLENVYFPESGIGSVMAVSISGKSSEAGMFGYEGFVPTATIIGDDRVPYSVDMHLSGRGYSIPISAMREATMQSPTLQVPLLNTCTSLRPRLPTPHSPMHVTMSSNGLLDGY